MQLTELENPLFRDLYATRKKARTQRYVAYISRGEKSLKSLKRRFISALMSGL
jgi:hypothetical protein